MLIKSVITLMMVHVFWERQHSEAEFSSRRAALLIITPGIYNYAQYSIPTHVLMVISDAFAARSPSVENSHKLLLMSGRR